MVSVYSYTSHSIFSLFVLYCFSHSCCRHFFYFCLILFVSLVFCYCCHRKCLSLYYFFIELLIVDNKWQQWWLWFTMAKDDGKAYLVYPVFLCRSIVFPSSSSLSPFSFTFTKDMHAFFVCKLISYFHKNMVVGQIHWEKFLLCYLCIILFTSVCVCVCFIFLPGNFVFIFLLFKLFVALILLNYDLSGEICHFVFNKSLSFSCFFSFFNMNLC